MMQRAGSRISGKDPALDVRRVMNDLLAAQSVSYRMGKRGRIKNIW
jgi:hypothetical protein